MQRKAAAGPPFSFVVVPAAGRQPDDAWRVHEVAGQRPALPCIYRPRSGRTAATCAAMRQRAWHASAAPRC
ncbi:hypothetical protein FEO89_09360 [Stenotrophomonas maltophilia]|nr:hypothetical protein FEO89_09360 [Stenotrophomonas maltophilia]QGM05197.1 hypothetical protein FEO88_09940 [Stenotrophomonas maltophilia]